MDVLHALEDQGISIRVASPKLVMEEVSKTQYEMYFFFLPAFYYLGMRAKTLL